MRYAGVWRVIVCIVAIGLVAAGTVVLIGSESARMQNPFQATGADGIENALRCYLMAGGMVLLYRGISMFEAQHLRTKGLPGTGEIVSVLRVGRPENKSDRHWYQLVVRVEPEDASHAGFTAKVIQLVKDGGERRLVAGTRVPLKYLPGSKAVLLMTDGALASIRHSLR